MPSALLPPKNRTVQKTARAKIVFILMSIKEIYCLHFYSLPGKQALGDSTLPTPFGFELKYRCPQSQKLKYPPDC